MNLVFVLGLRERLLAHAVEPPFVRPGVRVDRADEGAEGFPTCITAEDKEESRRHRRLHVVRSGAEGARVHFVHEVEERPRNVVVQER